MRVSFACLCTYAAGYIHTCMCRYMYVGTHIYRRCRPIRRLMYQPEAIHGNADLNI